MPKTKRRRTSRLLKQIYELQLHDIELTAPFCVEVKHLFKNNRHLTDVEIAGSPAPYRFGTVLREQLPNFIVSQLDGQGLTSETQPTVEVTDLLDFLLSLMPTRLTRDQSSATFFHWQCPRSHRTSFLVAYIDQPSGMSSAIYTVEQLLKMRDRGAGPALPGGAAKNPGHGNLCLPEATCQPRLTSSAGMIAAAGDRAPETALPCASKPKSKPRSRENKNIGDSSSTDSDEIVYKGNPSRRGMPQEIEWKFRGRSESEAVVSEPLPAPTGLNAQRSEGFQRFYKAVVSPTHVRVTAGGRIVPNTRGSSSPISKRVRDKGAAETTGVNGHAVAGQPEGTAPGKWTAMPMLPPPYYPHYPGTFPHMGAPMGMMPMPAGFGMPGGFPYPPAQFSPGMAPNKTPVPSGGSKENHASKPEESQAAQDSDAEKAAKKIKISPPEQFDHTRPFIYNGQVMVPFPTFPHMAPAAYVPPPMMGHHPAFAVPFAPPPPMMPPSHLAMHAVPTQASVPPPPATVAAPAAGGSTETNAPKSDVFLDPPAAPPISSIRPSEITRKQIEALRNSLKYHEDQLQYNRHQIDEKDVQKTVEMLQHHIARFESLNKLQSEFEAENYPKRDQAETRGAPATTSGPAPGPSGATIGTTTVRRTSAPLRMTRSEVAKTDPSAQDEVDAHLKQRPDSPPLPFRKPETVSGRPGINTNRSNFALFDSEGAPPRRASPVRKSTLPSGAALAAPFEPRAVSDKLDLLADEDPDLVSSGRIFHRGGQDEREARLLSAGAGSWDSWAVFPAIGEGADPYVVGAQAAYAPDDPRYLDLGRPYLVGKLPAGMDTKTAKDADYVYERELTEDETRARYLYWGKAPLYARKGLPKYDGKNFYPASPRRSFNISEPRRSFVLRDIDFDFEVDKADPFLSATPVKGPSSASSRVDKENTPPVGEYPKTTALSTLLALYNPC